VARDPDSLASCRPLNHARHRQKKDLQEKDLQEKDPTMTAMTRVLGCAALISFLLVTTSAAEAAESLEASDGKIGDIAVTQAWSRATPLGAKVAGGYLTIENRGSSPERLVSVSTAAAKRTEIHDMTVDHGVMKMRPVDGGLLIEPGQAVRLAPGGAHLMFMDLNAPLRQGERVPVTLAFEHAGDISIAFDVESLGAQSASARDAGATAAPPARTAEAPKQAAPMVAGEADDSFFTHLHAVKAMANVTVSPGRAGPVEIAIQLENADELPLAADAVSVTLGNPERGIAPIRADAERVGNDRWRVRMSAPLPGRWSLGLGIAISATDTVNVVSPILLK
jgi:periplasmic copper chaperone A